MAALDKYFILYIMYIKLGEDMAMYKFYVISIAFFSIFALNLFSQDLPRVMYVNSKEGLNQRSAPLITAEKVGTLLYGERIIVYERSNNITIEGITNYWYRTSKSSGGWCWVFGGYLSDEMPIDVEPVLGRWNTDRGDNLYWYFTPQHKVSSGRKETDIGIYGNWKLSGNILTIDLIPTEFMTYDVDTIIIEISIVDKDTIIFLHNNGIIEKITRNNNII
jgi:hypothetical protein